MWTSERGMLFYCTETRPPAPTDLTKALCACRLLGHRLDQLSCLRKPFSSAECVQRHYTQTGTPACHVDGVQTFLLML